MNRPRRAAGLGPLLALPALVLISGCGLLDPKVVPLPSFYILAPVRTAAGNSIPVNPTETPNAPILVIHQPEAAPGYDSPHIVYSRDPLKLEYFAHSDWVDTPARMLAPMILAAFDHDAVFGAVLPSPSPGSADLSLDVLIVQFQQSFETRPSHVRLMLRATLTDNADGRVLALREFDEQVAAPSDDPQGGVIAADVVVASVLRQLVVFCNGAAALRQP